MKSYSVLKSLKRNQSILQFPNVVRELIKRPHNPLVRSCSADRLSDIKKRPNGCIARIAVSPTCEQIGHPPANFAWLAALFASTGQPFRSNYDKAKTQDFSCEGLRSPWTQKSHTGGKIHRRWFCIHHGINGLYMILTLPHAVGGYGLSGAVFNYKIKLKDEAGKRLGQKRCFEDLYYKQAKLAVEYESFAFHNSPSEQGKDAMRSATLDRQGVEVMRLSTVQLYDKDACKDFTFNLASRLGKRIQIRTKKFGEMHELLLSLLPAGKPITNS